jgi:hypothetical protein
LEGQLRPPLAIGSEELVLGEVRLEVGYGAEGLDLIGFPLAESPDE